MVKKTVKKSGAAGIGLAALAAAGAAAGYFFYASEGAEKNRKIAATWATNMKKDIVKEAKKVKNIRQSDITKLIDGAAKAYASSKGRIDAGSLSSAARELKKHWSEIKREAEGDVKSVRKSAQSAKKAAKKMVTKVTRKM
jgi:hypothetical protein